MEDWECEWLGGCRFTSGCRRFRNQIATSATTLLSRARAPPPTPQRDGGACMPEITLFWTDYTEKTKPNPHQDNLTLSGLPSSHGAAGGGARSRDFQEVTLPIGSHRMENTTR
ncbi:hypothetical protein PoB_006285900 [Plakobranchus ocellatus]|uniref:Uncharacterized protein n=1 Tax=Plakobranchus ocellatus TaxID=259542 RepID=A0AAV4CWT6_9GAST|nr:hypothetical protein PoB_006285900 [Plakobranchus ocellatus]